MGWERNVGPTTEDDKLVHLQLYTVKSLFAAQQHTMGTSLYRAGHSLLSVRLTLVIYPSTMSPNSGNVWQSCAATSPATKYSLSPHALTPFLTSMYMPAKYTCDKEEGQCVCVCVCVSVHGAVNVRGRGGSAQRESQYIRGQSACCVL